MPLPTYPAAKPQTLLLTYPKIKNNFRFVQKASTSLFGTILSLLMVANAVAANGDSDISHSHWLSFDCYEEGTLRPGKTSSL